MSGDDKLVFKTKEEKTNALLELDSAEPEGGILDVDAWQEEQTAKRKAIEDAIVEGEPAPPPPQDGDEETPTDSNADDVLNFTYKRSELPDELKGYKDSGEILKQFAHARKYANQAEEKLQEFETLSTEHKSLKEQFEALQEEVKKKKETPPPVIPPTSNAMDELEKSIAKLELMDENDYLTARQSKELFGSISGKVKDVLKEVKDARKELSEQLESTKDEFGQFKTTVETSTKEQTKQQQDEALNKSLVKLQEDFPELKLSKAVIGTDSVQNDVEKFARKVLGGKYNNYHPEWSHVSALVNAYLQDDPEIKEYCEKNAVTPESVGTSRDDIQKYVIIQNVHERVNGRKINLDGTSQKLINRFSGKDVSYQNHSEAYNALKKESGMADKELREMIADAEKRGQKNVADAMNRRATEGITIGDKGDSAPEDMGQELTEKQARAYLANPDLEFEMQTKAMAGDRSVFNMANKCLKRIMGDSYEPFEVDPAWPSENK